MCENIDWNVGRVLRRLDKLKLAENTIVIYFSDNGPNSWRWNDGMKGRKGSTDEGGNRVPCLVRWPGHIKPGTKIPQIAGAIDLLPTLADIAGIPVVGTKPLDGVSIKPLLLRETKKWPDRMIFSHQRGRVSVRTQRYRLDHTGKLFDITIDPGQYQDISKKKPKIASKLRKAVIDHLPSAIVSFLRRYFPHVMALRMETLSAAPERLIAHSLLIGSVPAIKLHGISRWPTAVIIRW
jgi:arylsulfatase A-like enzyme